MDKAAETTAIELQNVTKRFGGTEAVRQASLTVPTGTIYGFLGPNGAGKSTTINMLLDIIRPTEGKVTILGMDARADGPQLRRSIGYISGEGQQYDHWTAGRYISFVGEMSGAWSAEKARNLAESLQLNLNKKIREMSRGNRQKVSIIAMLARKTDLLILDEPTSGLDPLIQQQFRKLIIDYRNKGGTVFISSHEMDEVEALCDHVAFIRDGNIIAQGRFGELTKSIAKQVTVRGDKPVLDEIEKKKGVIDVVRFDAGNLKFTVSGNVPAFIGSLPLKKLTDITVTQPTLEQIFMQYYEKEDK